MDDYVIPVSPIVLVAAAIVFGIGSAFPQAHVVRVTSDTGEVSYGLDSCHMFKRFACNHIYQGLSLEDAEHFAKDWNTPAPHLTYTQVD